MSKKAEEFLQFSLSGRGRGLGRGVGRGTGSFTLPERAVAPRPPIQELASGSRDAPVQSSSNVQQASSASVEADQKICVTKPPTASETKEGSTGKVLSLSANYFRLIKKPTFEFCLYRVDFVPDIALLGMRKSFLAQHKDLLGGYLFDGQSMVYTTRRLPQTYYELECLSREDEKYKMVVKHTGMDIKMTDSMALQIFNLILRRSMGGLKMQQVGRNLYDPANKVMLSNYKVELWPGYITSIRQHEHDVLVCCEVSHKVMRTDTIYEILRDCKKDNDRNWQDKFKKEIIGSIVLTGYNNRTYRVDDVDFASSPSSTFMKKDREISYRDYYREQYNLTIEDPNQPMLVSNPKARDIRDGRAQVLFLVPELCRATGLTDKMRGNFQLMKAMADHTQMRPDLRKTRLLEFAGRLHNSAESTKALERFNTDIDDKLVSVRGRALPQETMLFADGKFYTNDDKVDWTYPMKTNPMFSAVPLTRWVFIYPQKTAKESEAFLKLMKEVAHGMKYEMSESKKIELPDDRLQTYTNKIEEVLGKDPKLIMVVLPNNALDRYAAIKQLTCVNRAVPTQIILSKTINAKPGKESGLKSIATKVIVQLNCKLGGAPWMIKFPLKGVMTIGFDVNHDTRDRSKSYGAFVASMDISSVPQYFSAVSPHKDGAEMSSNIEVHMIKALNAYQRTHGSLPERIFFYRDGVGDGQIEYVFSQEVTRLSKFLKEFYATAGNKKEPMLTFIIVNKRINTKIFLNKESSVDNPVSGTVVDNTITLPERYDFYLVSQAVRHGTVTPTSYNVIHDTNEFVPDKLQRLTYKHTHLYYNWSGTVRVPAVVQYAHKLAFLVGEVLHRPPSESFNNQLYFL